MADEPVKFSGILDSIRTLKDRSFRVTFLSQELSPEQGYNLFSLRDKFGVLIFGPVNSEANIEETDIPSLAKGPNPYEKTPSKRLRSIIYIYWKSVGGKGEFDDFYKLQMERVIDRFKEMLEKE